jgi:hypothetical protein
MVIKHAKQPTPLGSPPTQRFGKRATARLRIAAVLLGRCALSPVACGENFYASVLQAIDCLAPKQRTRLRDHVDWVEAYEREEAHLHRR